MRVTLRKSKALQQSIKEHLESIKPKVTVTLSQFDDAGKAVECSTELDGNYELSLRLIEALYEIRDKVAIKNAETGVSSYLSKVAMIEAQIRLLNPISKSETMRAEDQIDGMLDLLREGKVKVGFGQSATIDVSVVDSSVALESKSALPDLKRERAEMLDKLLDLNASHKIELSEQAVQTLRDAGLI